MRSMERMGQLSSHILKNSELLFERLGYGLSGNHTREGSRESVLWIEGRNQWISIIHDGRGIRRESDSAVFTILDSRASLRGKYREEILNTLPSMLVTDRLVEERFGEIQQEESKEVTI